VTHSPTDTSLRGALLTPVRSGALLDDVLWSMKRLIVESRASVIFGDLPVVLADERQLRQLFEIVITIVIKSSGEGASTIRITSVSCGPSWRFCICNNGYGLNLRKRTHVEYLGGPSEPEKTADGRSLLTIAKQIIDRHGESIRIKYDPDSAACIYFTLQGVKSLN